MYSFTQVPMSIAVKGLITCQIKNHLFRWKVCYMEHQTEAFGKRNFRNSLCISWVSLKQEIDWSYFWSHGLIDVISSAFFGEPFSSTRYFFFTNFVMMDQIISTIEGYNMWIMGCSTWNLRRKASKSCAAKHINDR